MRFPPGRGRRGSCTQRYAERFGARVWIHDTLAWSRQTSDVRSIETIWYSRREHHRSLARLARSAHRFEHIFPGHGGWTPAPDTDMSDRLTRLVDQLRS
jgi:hypothetical protein